MFRAYIAMPLALIAAPGAAQPADWNAAERVEIVLSDFKFAPEKLRLRGGRPYVLHFVNKGSGGHNFAARDFFSAASVRGAPPPDGEVELKKGASMEVALVPARGTYKVRCTHLFHTSFGMSGEVVVD